MNNLELKKTPFFELHKKNNGKLVDFGGWNMPVQFSSIIEEHKKVRTSVGIFDVSHMGEIEVRGADFVEWVDSMVTNNVKSLAVNQVLYSPMCYPNGTIVDDLLVYRFEDHILLVVNASNTDKDFEWLKQNLKGNVEIRNISPEIAQLAIQGPKAENVMQKLTDYDLSTIKFYWFAETKVAGVDMLISRTGYTGEDGFEIYFDKKYAVEVWEKIMEAGKEYDIAPIGLGARDSLRFEMKYMLYGNEIDDTTNPLEATIGWAVKFKKADYIGKSALEKVKAEGLKRKLVGLELEGKSIGRHNYKLFKDGKEIGYITSGIFSPSLNKSLALGYVTIENSELGNKIDVEIRGKMIPAMVVDTPFYKNGSRK